MFIRMAALLMCSSSKFARQRGSRRERHHIWAPLSGGALLNRPRAEPLVLTGSFNGGYAGHPRVNAPETAWSLQTTRPLYPISVIPTRGVARDHEFLHAQRTIHNAYVAQPTVECLTGTPILCRSH